MLSSKMKDLNLKVITCQPFTVAEQVIVPDRVFVQSGKKKKRAVLWFLNLVYGYLSEGRETLNPITQPLFCHFYLCST